MGMQMARASKEEAERLIEFLQFIEEFMAYGTPTPKSGDEEADPIDIDDEEFLLKLRAMWGGPFERDRGKVDACWMRVVFGYLVLHDNVCNQESDILELRSDWKAVLERHEIEKAVPDGG